MDAPEQPTATATTKQPPQALTSSSDPVAIEQSANKIDEELEQKVIQPDPALKPAGAVNGEVSAEEIVHAEEAPVAATAVQDESPDATPAADEATQTLEPEKPKDPEPSPALSPVKSAAQPATSPAAPSKSAVPKTWASLAAAAHRPMNPAVPAPQQNSSPSTQQTKAAPASNAAPATPAAPSATPATISAAPRDASPASSQTGEWTSVGDHKKQQSKAQPSNGAQEGPQSRAYIKNVHESVDQGELRTLLEKFGELVYFDISRQKVRHQICEMGMNIDYYCTELRLCRLQVSRRLQSCR